MTQILVITLIGDDRPGLVETLSAIVTDHHGNWLESSLAQLAGKFAGVVKVGAPVDQAEALTAALRRLGDLRVTVETGTERADDTQRLTRRLSFSLVGHDRLGIVREVSQVFARRGINVEKFASRTSTAPMSSELLFHAEAELLASADFDSDALKDDLERLSSDLIVDINLDETL